MSQPDPAAFNEALSLPSAPGNEGEMFLPAVQARIAQLEERALEGVGAVRVEEHLALQLGDRLVPALHLGDARLED